MFSSICSSVTERLHTTLAMGCAASLSRASSWEKVDGRLEGEERQFKPALPGTAASISRSYTSCPNLGAGHPSFARSHSSTVDWRKVARGSPSPIGRYMPGGGKLIGSSLVRSSKLESGRSTGSSTPGQPAPGPRLALA